MIDDYTGMKASRTQEILPILLEIQVLLYSIFGRTCVSTSWRSYTCTGWVVSGRFLFPGRKHDFWSASAPSASPINSRYTRFSFCNPYQASSSKNTMAGCLRRCIRRRARCSGLRSPSRWGPDRRNFLLAFQRKDRTEIANGQGAANVLLRHLSTSFDVSRDVVVRSQSLWNMQIRSQ